MLNLSVCRKWSKYNCPRQRVYKNFQDKKKIDLIVFWYEVCLFASAAVKALYWSLIVIQNTLIDTECNTFMPLRFDQTVWAVLPDIRTIRSQVIKGRPKAQLTGELKFKQACLKYYYFLIHLCHKLCTV